MASMAPTTSVFSIGDFHSLRGDLRLSFTTSSSGSKVVPLESGCDATASGDGANVLPAPLKSALIKSGRFLYPPLPLVLLRAHERSSEP